jgi:acyl-homoserine lactone acylase PvdQ
MDRRSFLQTSGLTAGAGTVGFSIAARQGAETVTADGLDGTVELLTDEFDVTHVYAESPYGVGYGQGSAQARDRLFQLDLLRLVARGESASLIGPSQLASDVEVKRDLYSETELEQQWAAARAGASTDGIRLIEGFADGVTDRMEAMAAAGELPGEFTLLGREPEPWVPLDTVAVIAYFIGFFGVSGGSELSNARTLGAMFDRLDEQRAWDAYGDINGVVVPDRHRGSLLASETAATDERALAYDEVPEAQFEAIEAARNLQVWGVEASQFDDLTRFYRAALGRFEGTTFGSNAVVVGGEYTERGRPMLAGGPQFGLLEPPVVHEVGLHGGGAEDGGFDAVGVGVVGTPGIVVGRTPDFAWTGTSARDDKTDTIAVELVETGDGYEYVWDGQRHEFATEEYVHEPNLWAGVVDGTTGPARVEQEVAYVEQAGTRMPVVAYNPEEQIAFVKRTTTRMQELEGALDWLRVGRADSREAFEETLESFPFGYNFLLADDEDIGFYRTGTVPDRNGDGDPRFPMPETHHEWTGTRVGRELGAWRVDPERGYVVNWNNAPAPGWRSPDSEFEWSGAHRADILDRLLREAIADSTGDPGLPTETIATDPPPDGTGGSLDLGDLEGLIEDASVQHAFAPRVVPHLVAAARAGDDRLQAMADELERWAGAENLDRWLEPTIDRWLETTYSYRPGEDGRYPDGGMAIYEAVRHELSSAMFDARLGPAAPTLEFDPTAGDALSSEVDPHVADHGPASTSATLLINALEGNTRFPWLGETPADRRETLQAALSAAADGLTERFDSDEPRDWRREAHRSAFFPLGGASADSIHMTNRASYQQAIAMQADGAIAKSVLPPGNSGHLTTMELVATRLGNEPDRLTAQLDTYAAFEYLPQPVTREAVERRAVESETFE